MFSTHIYLDYKNWLLNKSIYYILMNFCYLLRINLNRVFVIVSLLIYPSVASSDNIGNFANKLFNHYEYDDKINNYLKSIFSFGNSKKKQIT